jgi:hypothetical protein
LLAVSAAACAGQGRLLGTGGATEIEGQAGGGIVPWAVIAGYGTVDQAGGTVFIANINTGHYSLSAVGTAFGIDNRVEISFASQHLALDALGKNLRQQVVGAKIRLAGNLVYTDMPQLALGVQYKRNLDGDFVRALGARDDRGVDVYVAASKLFLGAVFGRNLLASVDLRETKANQIGLLGFGGDNSDSYKTEVEASLGLMLDIHTVVGVEYRQKPDNLGFAHEDNWSDLFIAWFPSKSVSLTVAYADLGAIAGTSGQQGFYVSVQAGF